MPSASATYSPRHARHGGRSSRSAKPAVGRVRWDRLGRIAMLLVLVALVYLYLSAGAHLLSSWKQSRRDNATVATMEREHRALESQHSALASQSTLEIEARQLDMVRPGERTYVVTNLPRN